MLLATCFQATPTRLNLSYKYGYLGVSVNVSRSIGVLTLLRAGLLEKCVSMSGASRQLSLQQCALSLELTQSPLQMESFPRGKAAGTSSQTLTFSDECQE